MAEETLTDAYPDMAAVYYALALCYYRLDYFNVSAEFLAQYLAARPASLAAINLRACGAFRALSGRAAETELRGLLEQAVRAVGGSGGGSGGAAAVFLAALTSETAGGSDVDVDDAINGGFTRSGEALRHNLVIFRGGVGAARVLPQLLGRLPEARPNLALFHLREGRLADAAAVLASGSNIGGAATNNGTFVGASAHELLVRAICEAQLSEAARRRLRAAGAGVGSGSSTGGIGGAAAATAAATAEEAARELRVHRAAAQSLFEAAGSSPAECDTIPGRCAMACALILKRAYADALLYLDSVEPYLLSSAAFWLNAGVCHAAAGAYAKGESALLRAGVAEGAGGTDAGEYRAWLARCHIMCGRPERAWRLVVTAAGAAGGGSGEGDASCMEAEGGTDGSGSNSSAFDAAAASSSLAGSSAAAAQTPDDAERLLSVIAHDCYKTGAFRVSARAFASLARQQADRDGGGGGGSRSEDLLWQGMRGACAGVFIDVASGVQPRDALDEVLAIVRDAGHAQADGLARAMTAWAASNPPPVA